MASPSTSPSTYYDSTGASFSLRPLFKLYVDYTVTHIVGSGSKVDISAYAQRTGTENRTPNSSIATKSFTMTGAKTADFVTSGSTASATWTYNWTNGDPQAVWSYTRYYPYSAGTSASMSLTAADGAGGLIGSATRTISLNLFAQPVALSAPTNPSVSVANTGTAGTTGFTISWSAVSGVSTYGIWWNTSFSAPSAGASPDFSGITGTSYFDQKTEGTTRYYWVSSQTVGTPSAWVYAGGGTVPANTIVVTYDYNGNGSSNTTANVTPGSTFTLPSAPTRTGYSFTGWNDASGNGYGSSGTSSRVAPSSGFTLFAQWSPRYYDITYNPSNGSVSGTGTTSNSTIYYPTTSVTARSSGYTPPNGYTFAGWSTSQDNTVDYYAGDSLSVNLDSNSYTLTLYAVWTVSAIYPSFTDSTVVSSNVINKYYSDSVSASNANSYSVFSGSLPPGITLNTSNGTISGTPTTQGSYSFVIRATSSTNNTTNTGTLTISITPGGKRTVANLTKTNLSVAKRWNGSSWVPLTKMKRWVNGQWTDIS